MAAYLPPTLHNGALSAIYNDADFNYQNSTSSVANSNNTYLKLTGGNLTGGLIASAAVTVNGVFTANGGSQINGSQTVTGTSTCQTSTVTGSQTVAATITCLNAIVTNNHNVQGSTNCIGGLNITNQLTFSTGTFYGTTGTFALTYPISQFYTFDGTKTITINFPTPNTANIGAYFMFRRTTGNTGSIVFSTPSGVIIPYNSLVGVTTTTYITQNLFVFILGSSSVWYQLQ